MGLFQFVKDAGQALGIGKDDKEKDEQGKAELAAVLERKREKALADMVAKVGLPVQDLKVNLEGSRAIVTGSTPTQEIREKIVLLLGNTQGIAEVDDRLKVTGAAATSPTATATAAAGATPASTTPSTFHTVAKGETLSAIAKQHYGSANKYDAIFQANRPLLENPDRIYPGQVLRIPPMT